MSHRGLAVEAMTLTEAADTWAAPAWARSLERQRAAPQVPQPAASALREALQDDLSACHCLRGC